jgi:hypothetical protein
VTDAGSVHVRLGQGGAVAIDGRYLPLIVSCFVGDVNLPLGMWYEQTIHEIVGSETLGGRRTINIHDATRSTRTSAEMRKFWADLSTRDAETIGAQTLHNFIVVSSPIMRGVITAVSWLNPRVSRIQLFPNLERAVSEAVSLLAAAGTPVRLPRRGFQYSDEVAQLIRDAPKR